MIYENLNETNFFLYAAKHYTNPYCYDTVEFYDDLNRFKYLKRLFSRYEESGELKERLILNHIITIYNIFGVEPATRMLFFKLQEYHKYLKPFLILLNYMPEVVRSIGLEGRDIKNSDIPMDNYIVEQLRKI